MKRVVLIDGENLVYGLREILSTEKKRAPRSVINDLNIRGMFEELLEDNLPTQIIWFGARLRVYEHTHGIKEKSEAAVSIQSAFVSYLQRQKIIFNKVGYLRAREGEPCPKCGKKTWKLAEKGVDVGLAVAMLTEADKKTELVVVTSDTDLVPAFKAAKKNGAKLMHIGFESRPISALSQISHANRTITRPLINKHNG